MKNKKGIIGMMTIFVLVLVIMVLAMTQNNIDTKTINSTIESMNWDRIGSPVLANIDDIVENSSNYITSVVFSIVGKAVDFFGYAAFEVGKLAMKLARDNPDIINYKVLLFLLLASLIAPLIYPVFIIIVSLILITKEAIQNRRERKALAKRK